MGKYFIVCVFLLAFSVLAFAQNDYQSSDLDETTKSEKTEKIDEFGVMGECEYGARLDNWLFKVQNEKNATGYIIFYQGKDVLPAQYETNAYERRARNYIAFREIDQTRLVFVNGGFREKISTELWLVPNGADPPKPTDTIEKPTIPTGKTFLYGRSHLWGGEDDSLLDEYILPSVKAREETEQLAYEQENPTEEVIEEKATEEPETSTVEEEIEIGKPTPEEIEESKFQWTNEKFGELIKNQKDSRGVIIFYADDAYYDVGKLQNHIEEGKRKIAEVAKISSSKIQVLFGGYRPNIETEFWIVPKKGESPKPSPEERVIEEEKVIEEENI